MLVVSGEPSSQALAILPVEHPSLNIERGLGVVDGHALSPDLTVDPGESRLHQQPHASREDGADGLDHSPYGNTPCLVEAAPNAAQSSEAKNRVLLDQRVLVDSVAELCWER